MRCKQQSFQSAVYWGVRRLHSFSAFYFILFSQLNVNQNKNSSVHSWTVCTLRDHWSAMPLRPRPVVTLWFDKKNKMWIWWFIFNHWKKLKNTLILRAKIQKEIPRRVGIPKIWWRLPWYRKCHFSCFWCFWMFSPDLLS